MIVEYASLRAGERFRMTYGFCRCLWEVGHPYPNCVDRNKRCVSNLHHSNDGRLAHRLVRVFGLVEVEDFSHILIQSFL